MTMPKRIDSATKLMFMLVGVSVCVGFFLNKISNEQFMTIVVMVFAFYYRSSTTTSASDNVPQETPTK